jgi:acetyl esterase/lipase
VTLEPEVDSEIAAALAALPVALPRNVTTDRLSEVRELMESMLHEAPASETVTRSDHVVDATRQVELSIHRSREDGSRRPCIFWIHGGGLIAGSYRAADVLLQGWTERYDCVVASVRYRLAPEHPYPAALDDCYAGLRWTKAHAEELGIDPERIGVAGASAGGNLAAAVALLARDRGEVATAFQILLSPMLDDRMRTRSSRWPSPTWDPWTNETAWRAYLGPLRGEEVPAYAAPARAADLTGLPRSYVSIGGADIFLDEAVAYANALTHAGVPTELHVYPGGVHGFENLAPRSRLAELAAEHLDQFLAMVLAKGLE